MRSMLERAKWFNWRQPSSMAYAVDMEHSTKFTTSEQSQPEGNYNYVFPTFV